MENAAVLFFGCLMLLGVSCQSCKTDKVDGKINFDVDNEEYADVTTPALEAVVDLTNSADGHPRTRPHGGIHPKTSSFGTRQRGFVTRTIDSKKRKGIFNGVTNAGPSVVNNVQIVVNGNGTELKDDECQNGVRNISVTSRPDGEGNIITDVHLTIVTNTNAQPKINVNEVPVINGYRGTENTYGELPPVFHIPDQRKPIQPSFYRPHDIPQIPPHNYLGNRGTWYNNQRPFVRPPPIYRYDVEPPKYDFRSDRPWQPSRSFVDDKIEPPLSKTKPSHE